jgi:hypothetical protein
MQYNRIWAIFSKQLWPICSRTRHFRISNFRFWI